MVPFTTLNWDNQLNSNNFKKFKNQPTLILDKGPLRKLDDDEQVAMLLNWISFEATELFNTNELGLTTAQKEKLKKY